MHPEEWYADNDVDLRRGVAVAACSRRHRGRAGRRQPAPVRRARARHRLRAAPAADARRRRRGVLTLRTREDSDAIRATFGAGKRLAIIGGGWIGLEVAAAARDAGTEVTVLEAAELPLLGVLGREMATVFADLHREHGVDLRLGVSLAEITSRTAATGVRLADGSAVEADAVVVGVGVPAAHRAGRGGRARRRQRRPGRRVAPLERPGRSSPSATSPTTTTRCSAAGSASSTGPTALTSRPPPPRRCSASDAAFDRAALLLQRPVRPRHGVRRARDRRRAGRGARRPRQARVRGVLAGRRRPDPGRDERQRVGHPGPGQAAHRRPRGRRPGQTRRPGRRRSARSRNRSSRGRRPAAVRAGPSPVRAWVARRRSAHPSPTPDPTGGMSPGRRGPAPLADGRRAFVKAVGPALNPDTPALFRHEIRVLAALPSARTGRG